MNTSSSSPRFNRAWRALAVAALGLAGAAVAQVPPPNPATLAIGLYAGLTITGTPGNIYDIQYRADLGPPEQWTSLASLVLTATNQFWVDPDSPAKPQRYYRAVAWEFPVAPHSATDADDFNDGVLDEGLWGSPLVLGAPSDLTETDGALRYAAPAVSIPENSAFAVWHKANLPGDKDWEVQASVQFPDLPLTSAAWYGIGLFVTPDSFSNYSGKRLTLALDRDFINGPRRKVRAAWEYQLDSRNREITTSATNVLLRLKWEATVRALQAYYSKDGGTNWLYAMNIYGAANPWSVTSDSTFVVGLFAYSGQMVIQAADGVAADDFHVAVAEPKLELPELVWIAPGSFIMGSPDSEPGRASYEGPQTLVTLTRGFWMGTYEVTQAEYRQIMRANPSSVQGQASLPVETVSWQDATNYCARLTQRERSAGRLPQGYEYRLPTEAQWEYACRRGTTTAYSFGSDGGQLGDYAWYSANSGGAIHPVGQKKPNPRGLFDMHGNVWELCLDHHSSYERGHLGGRISDYFVEDGGYPIARGKERNSSAGDCRAAKRTWLWNNAQRGLNVGFRIALVPAP